MKLDKISRGQTTAPSTWLYGPWLDLVVGCGAWSAPLLLLSYFSIASSTREWSIVFYALALVFNYPHYMATIYRAYHRAEDFNKYRFFTLYTTTLVVVTIFLSHLWVGILPWIFTVYLTWSPWHYSGQNYGLFMMFARRAGASPGQRERRALYGAFIVSYLVLFLEFHTGASSDSLFLSLGIPNMASRYSQAVLCAVFVGLSIFGWSRLLEAASWRKLLPCAVLFSSQCLWFLVPVAVGLLKNWAAPQSRYSSGVLAIMHSAQYLWITSYYARREASESQERSWRPSAYFGLLFIGGIALFVPGPWLASRIFHHDFGVSFLIFTSLVNLHHFILDGAIWKLRDGRIAALLLNSKAQVTHAASQTGRGFSRAWQWISGGERSARAFRASLAIAMLVCGTVDQVRHYLSLRADLSDLRKAAYLDSYDSLLQMRMARRQLEDGHPQEAEVAWKTAMQLNPRDLSPRQALLRFLIDRNRFDEALYLTEASLRYSPKDANLLVDRGLLALRLGHPEQAVASWRQALNVDRGQIAAQLYLANELDHEGKVSEAAEHYEEFLALITRQPRASRPAPEKVIAVSLRMADCQSRAGEIENALRSYQLAEKLAAETKQTKLESVADLNEAALDATDGRRAEAVQLYERALQLDDANGDRVASTQDWLAYGQFLEQSDHPAQLVYACYIKSSLGQSDLGEAQRGFLSEAIARTAKRVGATGVAIRRDPQPFLQQALSLTK
jgi:tetratricopeptide (TPR) repeat protein